MKIIREYSISHLKENWRNSTFIFVAIMIASSLICAMGVFSHTEWLNQIDTTISNRGSWQGHFEEPIQQAQLKYILENPQVKEVYIQSQAQTLKLSGTQRAYINLTSMSNNSWGDAFGKKNLIAGRLPEKSGEMVVSTLFLSENPQYKIGDTLILPAGERVLEGRIISEDSPRLEGESFQSASEQTVTITGSLHLKSVSAYPCYYAYGFLDLKSPLPEGMYIVSASLKNIHKSYELFPLLAASSGMKINSEGQYDITYNTTLLELYGVKDPNGNGSIFGLSGYFLTALLTMGLVMLVFIILIYNAFTVTSASQIKQLGILKSIGATPKQIRNCIYFEAFVLACGAVPLGITLGYLSMVTLINAVAFLLKNDMDTQLHVVFSWNIIMLAVLASACTVLLSAWGPARKLGKLLPIEAVLYLPGTASLKKAKQQRWVRKWFGFEGEIAINALQANIKAYRTTMISLTLLITLFFGFQCFATIWMMDQKQMLAGKDYTLTISTDTVNSPDPAMVKELSVIPGIQNQIMYRDSYYTLLWDEKKISSEFLAAGGYKDAYFGWNNLEREREQLRILVEMKGLDSVSFANYAKKSGFDPVQFNNPAEHKGLLLISPVVIFARL